MLRKIKYSPVLLGIILFANIGFAQKSKVDSLVKILNATSNDTARLRLYVMLCEASEGKDNIKYGESAVELADKILEQTADRETRKSILNNKVSALIDVSLY